MIYSQDVILYSEVTLTVSLFIFFENHKLCKGCTTKRLEVFNQEYFERYSGFAIEKDTLYIYFYSEVITYNSASGYATFGISYDMIEDIINTDGELWNSFDKDSLAEVHGLWDRIEEYDKNKILETINAYEHSMIDTINNNDFTLVEPWLIKDSSLYVSQKKLVTDLNQKKIKVRLENYTIEKIEELTDFHIVRVYVIENIAIQYPSKEYITEQFH